ncbi:hypothetical protein [Streptomyces sp. NPDC048496]|uniref:hypothetical protein n=1 Tax=Streptomyces sp. NPDC048496 TaxID=3365558 RepID=UPI0037189814
MRHEMEDNGSGDRLAVDLTPGPRGHAGQIIILDAGAVPPSLSAAAIKVHGNQDPLPIMTVANELLALWDRPQVIQTVLEGNLGPMP